MITVVDAVHPFASVTVMVCVPAGLLTVPVPEYGGVPPLAVTVTVELPPLQRIADAFADTTNNVGSVIVAEAVDVHPFASVTVKLYEPAVCVNVPVPEYGGVPPIADTVIVALPPLQRIVVASAV
ncbi:MAG: hypothetical protein WC824_10365, partial [Bacteroidota bacterium]